MKCREYTDNKKKVVVSQTRTLRFQSSRAKRPIIWKEKHVDGARIVKQRVHYSSAKHTRFFQIQYKRGKNTIWGKSKVTKRGEKTDGLAGLIFLGVMARWKCEKMKVGHMDLAISTTRTIWRKKKHTAAVLLYSINIRHWKKSRKKVVLGRKKQIIIRNKLYIFIYSDRKVGNRSDQSLLHSLWYFFFRYCTVPTKIEGGIILITNF